MSKCSLLVLISGTSALEALAYKKPSIIFADTVYSRLQGIIRLKSVETLPKTIQYLLNAKFNTKEALLFLNKLLKVSFVLKQFNLRQNHPFSKGVVSDADITNEAMYKFLQTHSSTFDTLADQHVLMIKRYKGLID